MSGNPNDKDKKKKEDDDNKKDTNEYFVGNGQAVIAPNPNASSNSNSNANPVASLFQKARDPNKKKGGPQRQSSKGGSGAADGAEDSTDDTGSDADAGAMGAAQQSGGQTQYFTGAGRRLGHNPDIPSLPVDDGRPVTVEIHVTFYRNGFTVDDGPLLSTTEGEGREILESFDRGVVPTSISGKHPRRAKFDVKLIKRDQEDYVKKFQAFDGRGQTLGGAAAASASSSSSASAAASNAAAIPAVGITVRGDAVRGRLLLQLPDGTRHRVEINPTLHTVSDLFGEAAVATGASTSQIQLSMRDRAGTTVLVSGDTRTLAEAKCEGAAIIVKI